MLLLSVLIAATIFGAIGSAVASNQGVNTAAGFWYGFFLGPIGLIIVALLKPIEGSQSSSLSTRQPIAPTKFTGEPDLSNDAYKIWLTSHYDIQKNEVLSSYVCAEHLFPSVDEALEYASDQHRRELEREQAESERQNALAAERHEAMQIEREEQARRSRKEMPYWIGGTLLLFGLMIAGAFLASRDENSISNSSEMTASVSSATGSDDATKASNDALNVSTAALNNDNKRKRASLARKADAAHDHSSEKSDVTAEERGLASGGQKEDRKPEQARPNADVRNIFSADDYPASAIAAEEQGTVQAKLTIDATGMVGECTIVRSSGSDSLDRATCNIIKRRAHFSPAIDASGNPTPSTYVTPPIIWRLEG